MEYFPASREKWIEGRGYHKKVLLEEKDFGIERSFIQMVDFTPGEKVPLHYHEQTKEVFIALDRARLMINGNPLLLEPNDVLICEPGDVHGNPLVESSFRILIIKVDYQENDTIWME